MTLQLKSSKDTDVEVKPVDSWPIPTKAKEAPTELSDELG